MKKLAVSLGIILAASAPAWATASITCRSDQGATVYLGAFNGPQLLINSVEIISGDTHWSTHNVDAEQMIVMQNFSDGESIKIDLADPNVENIIAKVRLFGAEEGAEYVLAGTLQMPNIGVYALICEGP